MREAAKNKLTTIESRLCDHSFPPQLVIESTSQCDQKCIHCSHKEMTRPKRKMERKLWDKIVEEVGREAPDTEIWPTFYGEALGMGEEIWDRIDYAAQVGCRNLVLNSNGGLLKRQNHIERILKSPLKRFIISIDGFTKETYEKIRYLGKHEKTYGGVEELLRQKQTSGNIYLSMMSALIEPILSLPADDPARISAASILGPDLSNVSYSNSCAGYAQKTIHLVDHVNERKRIGSAAHAFMQEFACNIERSAINHLKGLCFFTDRKTL